jgi:hypothetical protein
MVSARLNGDLCQCPHWGLLLCRQLTTTDATGTQETAKANDLFYWSPGHNVKVNEDVEIVMLSPQQPHSHVINHMIDKVEKANVATVIPNKKMQP